MSKRAAKDDVEGKEEGASATNPQGTSQQERVQAIYERIKDFCFDEPMADEQGPSAAKKQKKSSKDATMSAAAASSITTFAKRYACDFGYEAAGEEEIKLHLDEYLKFQALKCVLEADGEGATPSIMVDNVWHTHLLHTRSYHRLCELIYQPFQFIHHEPSTGTSEANLRYRANYKATMELYLESFAKSPSFPRMWPPAFQRFDPREKFVCVTKAERDKLRAMMEQGEAYDSDDYDPGCG